MTDEKSLEDIIKEYKEKYPDATAEDIEKLLNVTQPEGLIQKMTKITEEIIRERMVELEKDFAEKVDKVLVDQEDKFVEAFAVSMGLNKSVPVTRDEMRQFIRETLMKNDPGAGKGGKGGKVNDEGKETPGGVEKGEWDPNAAFEKHLSNSPLGMELN